MIEGLKSLLDAGKTTTYELLAVLLPGAIVLSSAATLIPIPIVGGTVGELASAYILGTAVQGLASFIFGWEVFKRVLEKQPPNWQAAHDYALKLIRLKLDKDFPEAATLDVCLTKVGERRQVYEKFVALRDMSRGLAVATVPLSAFLIRHNWNALIEGGSAIGGLKVFGAIIATIVSILAFVERYGRFNPLAQQAIYGQFIAMQLQPTALTEQSQQ